MTLTSPLLALTAALGVSALPSTPSAADPPPDRHADRTPPPPTPAEEIAALHARPALVAEREALVPGETQHIGVRFRMRDGWHIYWDGQNLAGYPPNFSWHAPGGVEIGPVLFPAPSRYKQPELRGVEHTYDGEAVFLVPVAVPADAEPGSSITITAEIDWLVCEKTCVPEDAVVSITLPIAAPGESPARTGDAGGFDHARARLAREYDPAADGDLRFTFDGGRLTIATARRGRVEFYPHVTSAEFRDLFDAAEGPDGSITLEVDPARPGDFAAVRGILRTEGADGSPRYLWIDRPIPEPIAG